MLECPHCRGLFFQENDDYGKYLTCLVCGRSYDFNLNPLRLKAKEWQAKYKINLTSGRERAKIGEE